MIDKCENESRADQLERWRRTVPPGCRPAGREAVSVAVAGDPAAQGSKRYVGHRRGKPVLLEQSRAVKPWRALVAGAVLAYLDRRTPMDGPFLYPKGVAVTVKIIFVMPRPKATPKRKATPPAVKRPDVDKMIRAVLDGIGTARLWADDSQAVTVHAHKRLAEPGETTGALIHVELADAWAELEMEAQRGMDKPVAMCGNLSVSRGCGRPSGHDGGHSTYWLTSVDGPKPRVPLPGMTRVDVV